MKQIQLIAMGLATLAIFHFTQTSQAHPGVRWSIGFNFGVPFYPHPYRGYGWAPYYYGPPAVIYEPAPVIVRPAPIVVQQPAYASPAPSVVPTPPAPVVRAVNEAPTSSRVDALLPQLNDAKESVRRDTAMDLGRAKAQKAIEPLMNLLAKDSSPEVRDAAARALGLIGSSRSLNALIYAAQADNDRDVRHSAQFSVEIIRTNLRGN